MVEKERESNSRRGSKKKGKNGVRAGFFSGILILDSNLRQSFHPQKA